MEAIPKAEKQEWPKGLAIHKPETQEWPEHHAIHKAKKQECQKQRAIRKAKKQGFQKQHSIRKSKKQGWLDVRAIDFERLYRDCNIFDVGSLYRRLDRVEKELKMEGVKLMNLRKEVQMEFMRVTGGGVYATPEFLRLSREAFDGLDQPIMGAAAPPPPDRGAKVVG